MKFHKRLGFTAQVHPDHREFIRVENEVEYHYNDPSELQALHKRAQIEVMLLNYDDALREIEQLMFLQNTPSFRTNVFDFLTQQTARLAAEKQALEQGISS